jgi:predicted regulator of Ras-like GTPase activity (Roadblock/LC7/MglB family)
MDVAQALAELTELSSQVERAVVLDRAGTLLGSTVGDDAANERLAACARDLLAACAELHPSAGDVTRVEVELADGAVFVLSEGARTIAAVTGPRPTAGLVAYDLRTCLQGIDDSPKAKRGPTRTADAEDGEE